MNTSKNNIHNFESWLLELSLKNQLIIKLLNNWFENNVIYIQDSHQLHEAIEYFKKEKISLVRFVTTIVIFAIIGIFIFKNIFTLIIGVILIAIISNAKSTMWVILKSFCNFRKDYQRVFELLDNVPEYGINADTPFKNLRKIANAITKDYGKKFIQCSDDFGNRHEITKQAAKDFKDTHNLFSKFKLLDYSHLNCLREAESALRKEKLSSAK